MPSRTRWAVAALALPLLLGACAANGTGATVTDSPTPTSDPVEVETPEPPPAWERLEVGDLSVQVPPEVGVETLDDGSALLTVPASGLATDPLEVLRVEDGQATWLEDGTVTLAQGAAFGGVVAHPPTPGVRVTAQGTTVALRADPAAVSTDDVTLWVGGQGAQSMTWGIREGGRSLIVVPTDWARAAGAAGVEAVWAQMQDDDEAATTTMYDQLLCHGLGAPDKDSWNLEPWRPDVGLLAVLAAACNPS
ncbi:DUF2599 domain-containing protein [Cellulomonas bogoriensis]|uniref:DUF2599 domain-containing protein n=1 Tax=Cellulomonas bogoriensis TaxID=301388 RepID=UPI0006896638|nr:DUF2599 domain-containing protein [Cellulomonas bogoriensis]